MGAGNEAINRVRVRIRTELQKLRGSQAALSQLTDYVLSKIWSMAKETISDLTENRAKVMIIYEVMSDDYSSGGVQEIDQKPADEKP